MRHLLGAKAKCHAGEVILLFWEFCLVTIQLFHSALMPKQTCAELNSDGIEWVYNLFLNASREMVYSPDINEHLAAIKTSSFRPVVQRKNLSYDGFHAV